MAQNQSPRVHITGENFCKSGVKKLFVIALALFGQENYENVSLIWKILNTECFVDDAAVRTFRPQASQDKLKQELKNYVLKVKIELELKFDISKQHNLSTLFMYVYK